MDTWITQIFGASPLLWHVQQKQRFFKYLFFIFIFIGVKNYDVR